MTNQSEVMSIESLLAFSNIICYCNINFTALVAELRISERSYCSKSGLQTVSYGFECQKLSIFASESQPASESALHVTAACTPSKPSRQHKRCCGLVTGESVVGSQFNDRQSDESMVCCIRFSQTSDHSPSPFLLEALFLIL